MHARFRRLAALAASAICMTVATPQAEAALAVGARSPVSIGFEFTSFSMLYADRFDPTTPTYRPDPGFTVWRTMTVNSVTLPESATPYAETVHAINLPSGTRSLEWQHATGWIFEDSFRYPAFTPADAINRLTFTPNTSAVAGVGETFRFGTFRIENGITPLSIDSRIQIGYRLTTISQDPALNGFQQTGVLIYDGTSNAATTPEQRADWIFFQSQPELGAVRVPELADGSNVGTIDLMGFIASVHLAGWANPGGTAFVTTSVGALPGAAIPLPPASLLFALGFIGLLARPGMGRFKR